MAEESSAGLVKTGPSSFAETEISGGSCLSNRTWYHGVKERETMNLLRYSIDE